MLKVCVRGCFFKIPLKLFNLIYSYQCHISLSMLCCTLQNKLSIKSIILYLFTDGSVEVSEEWVNKVCIELHEFKMHLCLKK